MKLKFRQDRAWLLATAKAVAERLKLRSDGTHLSIRMPRRAITTNTDGWAANIGSLGKGQPRLEIWFDRFTGYPERKLYACLRSETRPPLMAITKRVSRKLWPARTVAADDTEDEKFLVLTERLARSEFNSPLLEKYQGGLTYYGIYDPTRETAERVNPHFCARAAAFFEDVARALPRAAVEDEQREIYPRSENRKHVASHLHRERSRLLAVECKIRDNHECQVCRFRFEETYGRLGREFAEAHHLTPLARLRGNMKTRLEDLTTVCSNCHRMLHRMDGKKDDIKKLRAIVRNHS